MQSRRRAQRYRPGVCYNIAVGTRLRACESGLIAALFSRETKPNRFGRNY